MHSWSTQREAKGQEKKQGRQKRLTSQELSPRETINFLQTRSLGLKLSQPRAGNVQKRTLCLFSLQETLMSKNQVPNRVGKHPVNTQLAKRVAHIPQNVGQRIKDVLGFLQPLHTGNTCLQGRSPFSLTAPYSEPWPRCFLIKESHHCGNIKIPNHFSRGKTLITTFAYLN